MSFESNIHRRHNRPTTATQRGTTMRAVVQRRYGPADTLSVERIAVPELGPTEVLIEVVAAGVDRGVWHLMMGLPYLVRLLSYGLTKPKSPVIGLDVAGRVVGIGGEVSRFRLGDEVFGIGRGAYAEYAVADELKLAHKPKNIDFAQAAVAAVSGITALQVIEEVASVTADQSVLIIGASGGVGSYAVQIAVAKGARVTGVASGQKADFVRSLGAEEVIDYRTTDYLDGQTRYDAVIDTGGLNTIKRLRSALRSDGVLAIVGGEGGDAVTGGIGRNFVAMFLSLFVPQRLTAMISTEHFRYIERLGELMESGDVTPPITERFCLDNVSEAIRKLESGSISGKSAVIIRDE